YEEDNSARRTAHARAQLQTEDGRREGSSGTAATRRMLVSAQRRAHSDTQRTAALVSGGLAAHWCAQACAAGGAHRSQLRPRPADQAPPAARSRRAVQGAPPPLRQARRRVE